MGTGRRSAERAECTRRMKAIQIVAWTHTIAEAASYFDSGDVCGQAVNEMELGSLSNLDGNIRDRYSGDEFGYARSNALGFIQTAIHASNKILSRVVGSA